VPCDFHVPLGDLRYPEHLRGLELGFSVYNIQTNGTYKGQYDKLKEIGVNFEIKSPRSVSFDVIYSAAVAFKKTRGNLDVPKNFIVPSGLLEYPVNAWGLELGKALLFIRTKSLHSENKHKLISLGFVDSVKARSTFELVYSALKAYKNVYGDVVVPVNFVVPENDSRFLSETWGLNLGKSVNNLLYGNAFLEHRAAFVELGVDFDLAPPVAPTDFLTAVYPALKAYKAVNGNLLVPQTFIVSEGDVNYSKDIWGMRLGSIVHSIRSGGKYLKYKERLTALGFNFEVKPLDIRGFDIIYSALKAYKAVHDNLLVPQKFVVPEGDVRFPSDTWGMKLGINVKSIRNRSDYSEHRVKLEELGFVYKKKNKNVMEIE
jgi:hypothetical protein